MNYFKCDECSNLYRAASPGPWLCPRCLAENAVRGGQGRSADDVTNSASVIAWAAAGGAVLLTVLYLWSILS